jgi:hypothetical protein
VWYDLRNGSYLIFWTAPQVTLHRAAASTRNPDAVSHDRPSDMELLPRPFFPIYTFGYKCGTIRPRKGRGDHITMFADLGMLSKTFALYKSGPL